MRSRVVASLTAHALLVAGWAGWGECLAAGDVCYENFLYFAYGSNLLQDRIHINNPSAQFVGIGRLLDYRLDFITNATLWQGAVATVAEQKGQLVWGALWRLDCEHMESLDKQEGVDTDLYYAKDVTITTPLEGTLRARTYIQTAVPPPISSHSVLIPADRRPSITYLRVIILGAIQCGLPEPYVRYLTSIPHNRQEARPEILEHLNGLQDLPLYPSGFLYTSRKSVIKS